MTHNLRILSACLCAMAVFAFFAFGNRETANAQPAPRNAAAAMPANVPVSEVDCSLEKLGGPIPASQIGEPVRSVAIETAAWVPANGSVPAHCAVAGRMKPVDTSAGARDIVFSVLLPASWSHRAGQMGGGGNNGRLQDLTGDRGNAGFPTMLARGWAVYMSDSGHQGNDAQWALNTEALKNFGYIQMKKTHDAAWALIERMYGAKPRYSYYIGRSQGGREALTVAQRYPNDYDGIFAGVPVVNFSSLMLGPELLRIQEKPMANWVTPAKTKAIAAEVVRQCDKLDGLSDGIISNYQACRAIFDVKQGATGRHPWAAKRCPNNIDANPEDTSEKACLTDGQISTLEFTHSRYKFATPLANNNTVFGMWLPGYAPGASGLIDSKRYKGQEGAAPDAPLHSHLGVVGVTGFLMQNLSANPLNYVEGGPLNARRVEISMDLDATDPDLSAFFRHGGKLISEMGTNDTLASPGSQLDYYQSVIDKMGANTVDAFARFYAIGSMDHNQGGNNYMLNGDGQPIPAVPLAVSYDRLTVLTRWVEEGIAPAKYGEVLTSSQGRTQKLCSYPWYPRYVSGPAESQASYQCTAP